MRIRVLPTTAGRCLLVIDQADDVAGIGDFAQMLDRPRPPVDGVFITDDDVDLPALDGEVE